jgi:hypothetical protein
MALRLSLPSIDTSLSGAAALSNLWRNLGMVADQKVLVDCANTQWIDGNMAAALGGMVELARDKQVTVEFINVPRDHHVGTDEPDVRPDAKLGDIIRHLANRHAYAFHVDEPHIETVSRSDLGVTLDGAKPDKLNVLRWLEKRFAAGRHNRVEQPAASEPYLIAA